MKLQFKRFLSTLIDFIINLHLIALIIFLFGERGQDYAYSANLFCWITILLLLLFYFPLLHLFFRQTIGKKIMKLELKFRDSNYSFLQRFIHLFIRNIVAILENIFFIFPVIMLSLNGNRLSDMLSKTYVVSKS